MAHQTDIRASSPAGAIAFVAPRLAADGAVGGAETLLLNLARLAAAAGRKATFLTTCAKDHFTWRNERPAGRMVHDGLDVLCFPVNEDRDIESFLRIQEAISSGAAVSDADEERWLRASVNSRGLEQHLAEHGAAYDRIVAGPYLFGITEAVSAIAPEKTLLVPCLHDEPFARVRRLAAMFGRVAGCLFNTEPERQLAHRLFASHGCPLPWKTEAVVGFALEPFTVEQASFSRRTGIREPYIIYSGRRELLKGTPLLIDYWRAFRRLTGRDVKLVLTGSGAVDVPEGLGPHLIDLGFVSEQEKREAMAGAVAFCHASTNESLSIVLLEAWLAGTPALVHSRGEVLRYQCAAAQGGLWFRDYPEFHESLLLLMDQPQLAARLAANGRAFTVREYSPAAVQARLLSALG